MKAVWADWESGVHIAAPLDDPQHWWLGTGLEADRMRAYQKDYRVDPIAAWPGARPVETELRQALNARMLLTDRELMIAGPASREVILSMLEKYAGVIIAPHGKAVLLPRPAALWREQNRRRGTQGPRVFWSHYPAGRALKWMVLCWAKQTAGSDVRLTARSAWREYGITAAAARKTILAVAPWAPSLYVELSKDPDAVLSEQHIYNLLHKMYHGKRGTPSTQHPGHPRSRLRGYEYAAQRLWERFYHYGVPISRLDAERAFQRREVSRQEIDRLAEGRA